MSNMCNLQTKRSPFICLLPFSSITTPRSKLINAAESNFHLLSVVVLWLTDASCKMNVPIILFSVFTLVSSDGRVLDGLPTDRPLIIAHRGSSGMRPEHTVEAYQLAIEQGADIIECDVALTKDLQLICTHDVSINSTTDVHQHPEFDDKIQTYTVEGRSVTDYFTVDFTLEELKTLRKIQQNSRRDQSYNGEFPMASFDDYIAVAKNISNPRTVGIYPETKSPPFVNEILQSRNHNTTFEDILLESLAKHGYTSPTSPCFIQSFHPPSLQYMAPKTSLPLIYLTGTSLTDNILSEVATYCYGIGPTKNAIVRVVNDNIVEQTDFVDRIHAHGLKVHPYTFRNEYNYLAWDYGADPYKEYEMFVNIGVDGFFTDFPWSLSNYMALTTGASPQLRPSWFLLGLAVVSWVLV